MKAVPQQLLDEIRARNDIVEVIGSHIHLQKAGSSYRALCPFHKEKTSSFHVQPARQSFHCFGCGKGGDVFRFVMDHENVDFPTAIRLLARRAGITIAYTETEKRETSRKDQLYDIHEQVAVLYRRALQEDPAAEAARIYLRDRKLDGPIAGTFQIGYAPGRSGTLSAWAARQKIPIDAMITAGLIYPGEGPQARSPVDRFQNRLLFPIWDETGRVIGFSGRVLRKEDHPAKYVNSPETPLFHKSRILYALHLARRAIGEARCAILCEGQIDTIRCHAAGLTHTVAAQGTAATEDHARILRRYTDDVVLLLDSDEAGQVAAERTAGLFLAEGLMVRVASLPPGEDPDSFLLKNGVDALRALIDSAPGAVLFLIDRFERRGELATQAGVIHAAKAAVGLIARVPEAVPRDLMVQQVSTRLRIPADALRLDVRRALMRAPRPPLADRKQETVAESGPAPEEMALLEHLLQQRQHSTILACARHYLPPSKFQHPVCRELYLGLLEHANDPDWNPTTVRPEDEVFSRYAAQLVMAPHRFLSEDVPLEQAVQDIILTLWRKAFDRVRIDLLARLAVASGAGADKLNEDLLDLSIHLAALRRGWESALPVLDLHLLDA